MVVVGGSLNGLEETEGSMGEYTAVASANLAVLGDFKPVEEAEEAGIAWSADDVMVTFGMSLT